jgi:hypothetical protein
MFSKKITLLLLILITYQYDAPSVQDELFAQMQENCCVQRIHVNTKPLLCLRDGAS